MSTPFYAVLRQCHAPYHGMRCDHPRCKALVCQMCTPSKEMAEKCTKNWQDYGTKLVEVSEETLTDESIDKTAREYIARKWEKHKKENP